MAKKKKSKIKPVTKKKRAKKKVVKKAAKQNTKKTAKEKKVAKKLSNRKKTKKSKRRKKSVARPSAAAVQQSIVRRLNAIEARIASFQTTSYGMSLQAADAATVEVEFEKTGGPDLVRLTIGGTEVISPMQTGGTYEATVGEWITAGIEVTGNSGDKAEISVKKATPTKIELEIRQGNTQEKGTVPLYVTG